MPSKDTGHGTNVANFEHLISFCAAYGKDYNPSNSSLTLVQLKTLEKAANDCLQLMKTSTTNFENATTDRQLAFRDLRHLSTRVVNNLESCNVPASIVANARAIDKKIHGAKAHSTPQPEPSDAAAGSTPPAHKEISGRQLSYDKMIEHFTKLVETVSQQTNYQPNETELQTAGLQKTLDNMKNSNSGIINSYTDWSNARIGRTVTLYGPLSGLVPIAQGVKKYVKSVFGASSQQFNQVKGLSFVVMREK